MSTIFKKDASARVAEKLGLLREVYPTSSGKRDSYEEKIINKDLQDLAARLDPKGVWKGFPKHIGCVVREQTYNIGDHIFINHSLDLDAVKDAIDPKAKDFWVGEIKEIRAVNNRDVLAVVYWLYWPEDLPKIKDSAGIGSGRRNYHGENELVMSNHMDIVDVRTFAGKTYLNNYEEYNDTTSITGLYWRQFLDHRTGKLDELRKYCTCNKQYNPDRMLMRCANRACLLWLHPECIIHAALTKTYARHVAAASESHKKKRHQSKVVQRRRLYEGLFEAELCGVGEDGKPMLEVTDLRVGVEVGDRRWTEDACCPGCHSVIE